MTQKEIVLDAISELPDEVSLGEIAERIEFLAAIQKGMDQLDRGEGIPHEEVKRQLDHTRFAWIGGTEADSVFYYRIQSPVVLIEFDHQRPANLARFATDANQPTRQHIHAVVRTPNGNDYGKDLLRQHYLSHQHTS